MQTFAATTGAVMHRILRNEMHHLYSDVENFVVKEEESVGMFFHCMEENYFHADDEVAAALVLVFSSRGRGLFLRDSAIAYGTRCQDAISLVREPNFCIALLSECMRLWGRKYLKRLLMPTISTLSVPSYRVEVDRDRFEEEDDLYGNTFNLLAVAQRLLKRIITSSRHMPKQVLDTITQLAIGMGSDDARRCHLVISTFFFLRFVCPALVLPKLYGLLRDRPGPELQRKLILLAKVLQNIANQNLPSQKENYLKVTREFTRESIEVVKAWSTQLLVIDPRLDRFVRTRRATKARAVAARSSRRLRRGSRLRPSLLQICAFMLSNEDQIRAYFEQRARYARDPTKISQVYGRFMSLLEQLKGAARREKKRRLRWGRLRNLFVVKMCTTEIADQDRAEEGDDDEDEDEDDEYSDNVYDQQLYGAREKDAPSEGADESEVHSTTGSSSDRLPGTEEADGEEEEEEEEDDRKSKEVSRDEDDNDSIATASSSSGSEERNRRGLHKAEKKKKAKKGGKQQSKKGKGSRHQPRESTASLLPAHV